MENEITITNRDIIEYFRALQRIGTFGVYENTKGNGFTIKTSEEKINSFEDMNEIFISESTFGNKSIMIMMPDENDEIIDEVRETPKLELGFEASGLTIDEAIEQAETKKAKNHSFLAMMKKPKTGVTIKALEEEGFVVDE